MDATWVSRLKELAGRNFPSRKPQLWENFPMALRRRASFEVRHRIEKGWLDTAQTVDLSTVGFDPLLPPLRMEVVPREVMNKALYLYGTFEISETRLVQSFLAPGMTFVDVGANIGYYTLVAARMVGPNGAVHSFEPNIAVRSRLERNVRLNAFQNVTVHEEAMTRQSGQVSFYVSAVQENSGISSIIPGEGLGVAQTVRAVCLDDFVASLSGRRVDLLKMDIEGAELDVIEGGRQLLGSEDAPALLFESFDVSRLLPALEALGYKVRRLHYTLTTGLELHEPRTFQGGLFDGYESPNYFAVKQSSVFDRILRSTNDRRTRAWRVLGRL